MADEAQRILASLEYALLAPLIGGARMHGETPGLPAPRAIGPAPQNMGMESRQLGTHSKFGRETTAPTRQVTLTRTHNWSERGWGKEGPWWDLHSHLPQMSTQSSTFET